MDRATLEFLSSTAVEGVRFLKAERHLPTPEEWGLLSQIKATLACFHLFLGEKNAMKAVWFPFRSEEQRDCGSLLNLVLQKVELPQTFQSWYWLTYTVCNLMGGARVGNQDRINLLNVLEILSKEAGDRLAVAQSCC